MLLIFNFNNILLAVKPLLDLTKGQGWQVRFYAFLLPLKKGIFFDICKIIQT